MALCVGFVFMLRSVCFVPVLSCGMVYSFHRECCVGIRSDHWRISGRVSFCAGDCVSSLSLRGNYMRVLRLALWILVPGWRSVLSFCCRLNKEATIHKNACIHPTLKEFSHSRAPINFIQKRKREKRESIFSAPARGRQYK